MAVHLFALLPPFIYLRRKLSISRDYKHTHHAALTVTMRQKRKKQKATVVDEDHGVLTSLLNEVMSGLNFIKELAPKGRNCVSNDDKINR